MKLCDCHSPIIYLIVINHVWFWLFQPLVLVTSRIVVALADVVCWNILWRHTTSIGEWQSHSFIVYAHDYSVTRYVPIHQQTPRQYEMWRERERERERTESKATEKWLSYTGLATLLVSYIVVRLLSPIEICDILKHMELIFYLVILQANKIQ